MHHHKNVIFSMSVDAASVVNTPALSGNKGTFIDLVGGTIEP